LASPNKSRTPKFEKTPEFWEKDYVPKLTGMPVYWKIPVFGKDYIPVAENYIKLVPKCDDNYKILIEDHTSEDKDGMTPVVYVVNFTEETMPELFKTGMQKIIKEHALQEKCMRNLGFMVGTEYYDYVSAINLSKTAGLKKEDAKEISDDSSEVTDEMCIKFDEWFRSVRVEGNVANTNLFKIIDVHHIFVVRDKDFHRDAELDYDQPLPYK